MKKVLAILFCSFLFASYITVPNTIYQGSHTIVDAKKLDQNFSSITSGLSAGTLDINLYRLYINGILTIDQNKNLYLGNVNVTGNLFVSGNISFSNLTVTSGNFSNLYISTENVIFSSINTLLATSSTINNVNILTGNFYYISTENVNYSTINNLNIITANIANFNPNTLNIVVSTINYQFNNLNLIANPVKITTNIYTSANISISGNVSMMRWVTPSSQFTTGVNYQATSDLIVVYFFSGGNNGSLDWGGSIYTDSTSTPTTLIATDYGSVASARSALTCPVKSGDYWRAEVIGFGSLISISVMKIGK